MIYTFKGLKDIDWDIQNDEDGIDLDIVKMQNLKLSAYEIKSKDEDYFEGTVQFKNGDKIYDLEIEIDCGSISLNLDDIFGTEYTDVEKEVIIEWFGDFVDYINKDSKKSKR